MRHYLEAGGCEMKTLVLAGLLALSVSAANAAECAKYVHESDAERWLVTNGDRFRWNGAPYEPEWFWVRDDENPKIGEVVKEIGQENDADRFFVRFGNLDGVGGLIYDSEFYRKTECSAEDRAPKVVQPLPQKGLFDTLLSVE
jgi:hypothetical protein